MTWSDDMALGRRIKVKLLFLLSYLVYAFLLWREGREAVIRLSRHQAYQFELGRGPNGRPLPLDPDQVRGRALVFRTLATYLEDDPDISLWRALNAAMQHASDVLTEEHDQNCPHRHEPEPAEAP